MSVLEVDDIKRDEIEEIKKELKKLRKSLKEELRRELRKALLASDRRILLDISRDVFEEAQPITIISRDLVKMIRESIRRSLREKGEIAISELIESLPEERAAEIVKSLANPDRIKILKLLYNEPRTFTRLKELTKLESSSLSHHLKLLLRVGLLTHKNLESGYALTSRGRFLIRLLAFMHEALGGEEID